MSGMDFSGKVVLITGGASGIGRASASLFAAQGAAVAISDINEDKTREAARELGNQHVAAPGDVSDEASVATIIEAARGGLGKIDVLINCAGVSDTFAPTLEQSMEHWQRIIDINLTGTYLTCRAVAGEMLERGEGAIVNISSIAGLVGLPYRNAYTASKHGVAGLTKSLASEWGQSGIRVNAVSPGYVATPMVQGMIKTGRIDEKTIQRRTPMGRLATPDEIGNVMMFLASPLASYVNGVVIPIDGGYTGHGAAGPAADID
ncbi:MAG: SDR family NAD(P)-dependent oxidoreductase [Alphaproteobacteria bacterium]|nr:SDR family NAD(P)-dependent oxidoreductase [Alphaproteobacteria bacterium]